MFEFAKLIVVEIYALQILVIELLSWNNDAYSWSICWNKRKNE
jgi:hypothetical protein